MIVKEIKIHIECVPTKRIELFVNGVKNEYVIENNIISYSSNCIGPQSFRLVVNGINSGIVHVPCKRGFALFNFKIVVNKGTIEVTPYGINNGEQYKRFSEFMIYGK